MKSKPGVVWELRNFVRPINASMKLEPLKLTKVKSVNKSHAFDASVQSTAMLLCSVH